MGSLNYLFGKATGHGNVIESESGCNSGFGNSERFNFYLDSFAYGSAEGSGGSYIGNGKVCDTDGQGYGDGMGQNNFIDGFGRGWASGYGTEEGES